MNLSLAFKKLSKNGLYFVVGKLLNCDNLHFTQENGHFDIHNFEKNKSTWHLKKCKHGKCDGWGNA